MFNKRSKRVVAGSIVSVACCFGLASQSLAEPKKAVQYEIAITNLTKNQILSPVTVYTHRKRAEPLFMPGAPASPELAAVAEDADASDLVASLEADKDVGDVTTLTGAAGPVMPGETARVVVSAAGRNKHLSLVGMLVSTNDAFVGLAGVKLPRGGGTELLAPVWDAGSEANTESCEHIPGPPCGHPHVRVVAGAEEFVHIHSGIQGVGDLEPATYDFDNPGVRIVIRRIH